MLCISPSPSYKPFLSVEDALPIGGTVHLNTTIPWLWGLALLAQPARTPARGRSLQECGDAKLPASYSGLRVLTPPPSIMPLNHMA